MSTVVDVTVDHSAAREARRETIRALLRSKTFLVGGAILLFWILCAIFGYTFVPYDPTKPSILYKHTPPFNDDWLGTLKFKPIKAPGTHIFGTDRVGQDVFSRVITGSRDILLVTPLATLLGTVMGTALGLVLGYFRGIVDDVLSRIVEAVLALPVVIVALTAIAALGPSNTTIIIVIGVVFTPLIARTVRSAVLQERELEYVQAAKLRGERAPYILFVEILPNVLPPVIVEFTVRLGYAIFAVATLSFLGFGIQPPSPDWGLQVADHYTFISAGYWWESFFPAAAIASLVIGVNLVADAVQGVMER